MPSVPIYLVTRFALPFRGNDNLHLQQAWLERRCDLFENWCLPSVAGQLDSDFQWLIALDSRVPSEISRRLTEKLGNLGRLIFVEAPETLDFVLKREIQAFQAAITCRLDSDDAIHKTYIGSVRRHVIPGRALNHMSGLRFDLSSKRLVSIWDAKGPFLSLHSTDGQTVFSLGPHPKAFQRVGVDIRDTHYPMWLQTVSGSNARNSVKWHYPDSFFGEIASCFALPRVASRELKEASVSGLGRARAHILRAVHRATHRLRARAIKAWQRRFYDS